MFIILLKFHKILRELFYPSGIVYLSEILSGVCDIFEKKIDNAKHTNLGC